MSDVRIIQYMCSIGFICLLFFSNMAFHAFCPSQTPSLSFWLYDNIKIKGFVLLGTNV